MKKLLTLIFLLSVTVFGASFDCAKATSKVEKMICADAELSALDEKLSKTFKEAIQIESYREEIKKDQRIWQKIVRDKWCTTGKSDIYSEKQIVTSLRECLVSAYQDRIKVLSLTNRQYILVDSQNKNICSPVLDIINSDIDQYGRFIPENHAEFNWLKWENKYELYNGTLNPKGNERIGQPKFYQSAEFDINNDGKNEIVWYFFDYGKYGDEYERIYYTPVKLLHDINGSTTNNIFNSKLNQLDESNYLKFGKNFGQRSFYIKPFRYGSSYLLALFGYSNSINYGHHSAFYLTDSIAISYFNENNKMNDVCYFKKNLQNNKDK
jgi:uncharacterized protein